MALAPDVRPKRHVREDRELRLRVEPLDVLRRIGLGKSERLRFGKRVPKSAPVALHPAQDVVAGPVQDAGDARQPVAGKAVLNRADDGHAARDRRLEAHLAARTLGIVE